MKTTFKYLLVLVLASFVFVGCCTTHSKTAQWEYKTETLYLKANLDSDELNKAATDGWQFVSATAIPNDPNEGAVVVFKRLKH